MKKTIIGAVITALSLASAATNVSAADIQRSPYAIAPAYSTYNWIGPYLGVNLGYQWGSSNGSNPNGVMGGGQAGYNWQSGAFVFGFETDIQGTDASDRFASFKFANPWFGTIRGRAGFAVNNVLFYVTGGAAYGGGQVDFAGLSETHTHIGYSAGGGMEVGLTPNWSVKGEYLYVGLTDERYGLVGNNVSFDNHMLRFGANYRF